MGSEMCIRDSLRTILIVLNASLALGSTSVADLDSSEVDAGAPVASS